MIPAEIIIRIDVRDLPLIEVEQIVKSAIPEMWVAFSGRKCWIDLKLEEMQT